MATGDSQVPRELQQFAAAWWLLVVLGIVSIIAGIIVVVQPGISLATLALIAGIFLLVDGVFELVRAVNPGTENRGLLALLGALGIIVGIILVRDPITGVVAVALLLGIWLTCFGVIRFVAAFATDEHRAWNLVVATLEVAAGVIIIADIHIGVHALALVVGIAFILRGIGVTLVGWALRSLRA